MEGLETKRAWGQAVRACGEGKGEKGESGGGGGACLRSPGHSILPFASWQSEGMRTTTGEEATKREQQNLTLFAPARTSSSKISGQVRRRVMMVVVMYSGNARPTAATRASIIALLGKWQGEGGQFTPRRGPGQSRTRVAFSTPKPNSPTPDRSSKNRETQSD